MASIEKKNKARLKDRKRPEPAPAQEQLDLDEIGRELVDTTIQSFNEELAKSSPAMKAIAGKFSGLINEFFEGFRDGVAQEIELFKGQLATQPSGTIAPPTPGQPAPKPSDKPQKTQEELVKELQELNKNISQTVRARDLIPQQQKKGFGKLSGVASQFGIGVLGGLTSAIGGEEWAQKKIQQNSEMSAFVDAETKLRSQSDPEGFGKLSRSEQKKQLKTDFKEIKKTETELSKVEAEADQYRRAGYSDAQINILTGADKKRDELTTKLARHDPSRVSKPTAVSPTLSGGSEEMSTEDAAKRDQELDEVKKQTTLLESIKELLAASKEANKNAPAAAPAESGGMSLGDLPTKGGGKLLKGLGSGAMKLGKALVSPKGIGAMALAAGAYTAYKGYTGAEEESKAKIAEINEAQKSGKLSKQEADEARAQVASQTTENKGGALGSGAGMAAGAIGGAKVGAMLGTAFGPVGTVVGGLAGGAIGGIAGSGVGRNIGGLIGKGVAGVKSMIGMGGEPTAQTAGPKKEAGPNWKQRVKDYAPNSTPVSHLNKSFPGIDEKFIELARRSTPISDSLQSIQTHEEMLKVKVREMMGDPSVESSSSGTVTGPDGKTRQMTPEELKQAAADKNKRDFPKGFDVLQEQKAAPTKAAATAKAEDDGKPKWYQWGRRTDEVKKKPVAKQAAEAGTVPISSITAPKVPTIAEIDKSQDRLARRISLGEEMTAPDGTATPAYKRFMELDSQRASVMSGKVATSPKSGKLESEAIRSEGNQKAPVINVPPPTVINGGGGKSDTKVIEPSFSTRIKSQEPSMSEYIRSRYA